jgi:limonene-1,2-epoxide hydrolase
LVLPKQGFENTGQNPANYTPAERTAVAVVEKLIDTMDHHDTAGHMALIAPNVIFRGDALEAELRVGPDHYCSTIGGLGPNQKGNFTLQELYVVDAGRSGTAVLIHRQDINSPAGKELLGGYRVPVAALLRVQNGKIIEWFDTPVNKTSIGALPWPVPVFGLNAPVSPHCRPYALGSSTENATLSSYTAPPAHSLDYLYGTEKPEYFFNSFEESAAQAVRAFFTAWQPGDVLPLGAFVDLNVIFRVDPTATQLSHGRDKLLRQLCGSIGGTRKLRDLFVVGDDSDTAVLTGWDQTASRGNVTHGASYFRVRKGVIVEWFDMPDSGVAATNANSASCQEGVDAALGSR